MKSIRASVNKALLIVHASSIFAWVLFVIGQFSNLVIDANRSDTELWGPNAIAIVRPAIYLNFAAIAIVSVTAMLAKKYVSRPEKSESRLALPVRHFLSTVLIISMVVSAISAVSVFMGNFFEGAAKATITERILVSYFPIVLYTVLVLLLLLFGFVFAHRAAQPPSTSDQRASEITESGLAAHSTRDTAISFTLPIVAVATALIFGLVVYDITRTSLEAWVWVIVLVIVAFGVVGGTVFATRSLTPYLAASTRPQGTSIGAKLLNFVLSIIYVGVVTLMSANYATNAVQHLNFHPDLTISAYVTTDTNGPTPSDTSLEAPTEEVAVYVYGSSLDRARELTVSVEPSGKVIAQAEVSSDGWATIEQNLPQDISPGEGAIVAQAVDSQGETLRVEMQVAVDSSGDISIAEPYAQLSDREARVLPLTLKWVLNDFVPALVMLLLVNAVLYLTLNRRNPEVVPTTPETQQSR